MAADTLTESMAALTGLKANDLKRSDGGNLVRTWQTQLSQHGYEVKSHLPNARVDGQHIVLYSDHAGNTQAALSDSETVKHVRAISRLSVTKTAKGDSKES